MKKYLFFLSAAILASSFVALSFTDVVSALKTGNAKEVAQYFDSTIEITLPGKSDSYRKSKAEEMLRDFFTNNPVKGFEVIHKSENAGSQYCIGNLITSNGKYRTTIYMKQKGKKQLIQELRFEK
ncbi:MAG: DUF4783 domain-containing protein [Ginsengibacter sp.]